MDCHVFIGFLCSHLDTPIPQVCPKRQLLFEGLNSPQFWDVYGISALFICLIPLKNRGKPTPDSGRKKVWQNRAPKKSPRSQRVHLFWDGWCQEKYSSFFSMLTIIPKESFLFHVRVSVVNCAVRPLLFEGLMNVCSMESRSTLSAGAVFSLPKCYKWSLLRTVFNKKITIILECGRDLIFGPEDMDPCASHPRDVSMERKPCFCGPKEAKQRS